MSPDRFHELSVHALGHVGIDTNKYPLEYVKAALDTCKAKVKQFSEVKTFADFYFKDAVEFAPEVVAELNDIVGKNKPALEKLRGGLSQLPKFTADAIGVLMKAMSTELGVGMNILVHPTRLACTGRAVGPSLYHLMEVLGKEKVLARFDRALAGV